ncbi:hypothetical protein MES5069_550137 [Mesorhizobium escarrei]|uniref:Uncharacterized protein n=1 Tax=Mesorhizobium escarrei TaxID=666018 RepID=A0ABN8KDA8_9HYPH|nr:hypothetical protein MES5069_550137 [Mesorhizobium escarrei]
MPSPRQAPAQPLQASAHEADLSLALHPNTYPGVHILLGAALLHRSRPAYCCPPPAYAALG